MATRYWVGGGSSAAWNATGNTNWGTASNTRDNASVPGASDDVIFDNAANGNTASTISANISIKSLVMTGWANTLTHNANVILTVAGTVTLASGMTYTTTAASSRIIMTETATLTTAGKTLANLTFNGSGKTFTLGDNLELNGTSTTTFYLQNGTFAHNDKTVTLTGLTPRISGAVTFYNLTITGTAATTNTLTIVNDITVSNNLVINGNSGINRVLVSSSTLGTQRTITAANVTVTNADFRDVKGAGAGSWNLSAITGGSGDCGGNSDITFTTADDWYWHADTGNWSNYAKWYTATNGGGTQMASTRVPLPQDMCYFDANSFDSGSQVITQDMPRIGGMVWTGATNTPRFTTSTTASVFGSITLISGMTLTASTETYTFEGRGSYVLTSATKSWGKSFSISIPGGSLTLGDDFVFGNNRTITMVAGTFDAADYAVTGGNLNSSSTVSKTLNMGNGLWTMQGNNPAWSPGNTLTVNAEGSTIKFTNSSNNDITFAGGINSKTYNNVWFSRGSSTATITITGANTFADLKDDGSEAHSIVFPNSTTTVTSLTVNGSSGKLISLIRTGSSGSWTIFDSTGTNTLTYCNISNSTASGGATFTALTDDGNVDGGNNTGWNFTASDANAGNFFQLF